MRAKSMSDPTLFGRYMDVVTERLGAMSKSADYRYKPRIAIIDELVDVSCRGADRKHFMFFHTYVSNLLHEKLPDAIVLQPAARALGHLARAARGAISARIVEHEVGQALEWTMSENQEEMRRLAAVLILREMAQNAPTLFHGYVNKFFECIGSGCAIDRRWFVKRPRRRCARASTFCARVSRASQKSGTVRCT